ncbi:MobA/MobL family protein [Stenotrophomonas maltophilia]|uniref:MobQ family relaxase n=1 Tax=Stenotrophomonas maltophilia TaxID=40324 RepID=UPI0013DC406B|nr:MobQ family relaxase [Stenotrophomonas maltophilia]ELN2584766.1 MobA/MobL family protein [Stenotrophomonas maltophilia]ELN2592687.1 MobA/MobL family protein [Stenotrophomonas maltophilia]MBH1430877.1 MobA/MobL family protein [Stenotrophomonas maltophilia]MBH1552851.1 MobA/MobL family protein [Stenotrophomonas maltophilia]
MAIYHCSIKSISRSQGSSVTAAAAYRAGIRIEDDTTGLVHDYTRKKGVVSVDMLAPVGAPTWVADPSMLWNAAEATETRKNARVGREMIVALPHEMSDAQRRDLAIGIGQMLVDRYNVAAQVALHAPDKEGDQRNHHAHILFTSRQVGAEGLGAYASKILDDFKQGRKEVTALRAAVAQIVNRHLERGGYFERVDARSLVDQNLDAIEQGDWTKARETDRLPTVKEGHAPGQRRARRAINARIRNSNAATQRKWDMWEQKARNEGRLMPAANDTQIEIRSNNGKSHQSRTRPNKQRACPPLTRDHVDTCRLRSDSDGAEPVLRVPVGNRLATLKPRWGEQRSGGPLRGNEPRHRSAGASLHGVPTARLGAGGGSGGGRVRLTIDGDASSRQALMLMQERLDLEEEARQSIRRQQRETETLLAAFSSADAIRLREAQRQIARCQAWLTDNEHEEQRRFRERERRKREVETVEASLRHWKVANPEPWRYWPAHKKWLASFERRMSSVRTARKYYEQAMAEANLRALEALEQERGRVRRALARAEAVASEIAGVGSAGGETAAIRSVEKTESPLFGRPEKHVEESVRRGLSQR